jgi:hypothetical protein
LDFSQKILNQSLDKIGENFSISAEIYEKNLKKSKISEYFTILDKKKLKNIYLDKK